ncbi:MAG: hypothetical protein L0H96_09425 [Humibacillus sp.]|nr:hypothetical protein [Humibacillus sp.]MDN5777118.1 hypothetical protein [Humibacillus sp.]
MRNDQTAASATPLATSVGRARLEELTEDQLGALCALTACEWSSHEVASVLAITPETVIDVRAMLGWPDRTALAEAGRQIRNGQLDLLTATTGSIWFTSSCTWCGGPGEADDGSGHLISCTQCPGVFPVANLCTWCSRCQWWLDGGADLPAALAHHLKHDLADAKATLTTDPRDHEHEAPDPRGDAA